MTKRGPKIRLPALSLVTEMVQQEAEKANTTVEGVFSHCRRLEMVWARYRVWHRLRALGYSLPAIAHHFKVDHSTVYYALGKTLPEHPWFPRHPGGAARRREERERLERQRVQLEKLKALAASWSPPTTTTITPISRKRLMAGRA
jgi:hypothetical protein